MVSVHSSKILTKTIISINLNWDSISIKLDEWLGNVIQALVMQVSKPKLRTENLWKCQVGIVAETDP